MITAIVANQNQDYCLKRCDYQFRLDKTCFVGDDKTMLKQQMQQNCKGILWRDQPSYRNWADQVIEHFKSHLGK